MNCKACFGVGKHWICGRRVSCNSCDGMGTIPFCGHFLCTLCEGRGRIDTRPHGSLPSMNVQCPRCDGCQINPNFTEDYDSAIKEAMTRERLNVLMRESIKSYKTKQCFLCEGSGQVASKNIASTECPLCFPPSPNEKGSLLADIEEMAERFKGKYTKFEVTNISMEAGGHTEVTIEVGARKE